jgi:hypothetical protein
MIHVQWDPERSIRGADSGCNSIQVGLSRHIIQKYVDSQHHDSATIQPPSPLDTRTVFIFSVYFQVAALQSRALPILNV